MAKKKKPKKVKQLYDENGNWVEERGRIKGLLRKAFRLSPQHKETLLEARVELPPKPKKDGSPGKQVRVRYRCAMCKELFQYKKGNSTLVQIDHIITVVPLWKTEVEMNYDGEDGLVRRVMCKKSNLQVLCSTPLRLNDGKPSCHKTKTDKEKFFRDKFKKLRAKGTLSSFSEGDKIVKEWHDEYKTYLVKKEEKELAKEERKRLKELKKRK